MPLALLAYYSLRSNHFNLLSKCDTIISRLVQVYLRSSYDYYNTTEQILYNIAYIYNTLGWLADSKKSSSWRSLLGVKMSGHKRWWSSFHSIKKSMDGSENLFDLEWIALHGLGDNIRAIGTFLGERKLSLRLSGNAQQLFSSHTIYRESQPYLLQQPVVQILSAKQGSFILKRSNIICFNTPLEHP